ncbi:STAS domain-containing protein [Streptosporangiaceae bacterium NEAU-GS5]|nr:STAS domain-containing protein [Streptosporangiaceae bacterium NEAU-GS5]
MTTPRTLSLRTTTVSGVGISVVHVEGILDATTRDQFADYLDTTSEEHGPDLILDLAGATFMDSRALGLIVHHWQLCTQAGGRFALVGVHYPSSKVMWVTGLAQRLPIFETLDDAAAALA